MAVAERELLHPVRSEEPRPFQWNCELFHRAGDLGVFEGQPVILVEGEILAMPPIGPAHQGTNTLAGDALRQAFGAGFVVREQAPFNIRTATDPQPDIAVVHGTARDYIAAHPSKAALIVEISVSTLAYDRGEKAGLYARAGIDDYWIVNIEGRQVEVYRSPRPDTGKPFDFGYTEVTIYKPGETIRPLAKPEAQIAAADLLP